MPRYQIAHISEGVVSFVLSTFDVERARRSYYREELCRLFIDGRMLRIYEADAFMGDGKNSNMRRYAYMPGLKGLESTHDYLSASMN